MDSDLPVDVLRTAASRNLVYRRSPLVHAIEENTFWVLFAAMGAGLLLIGLAEFQSTGFSIDILVYSGFAIGLLYLGLGSRRSIVRSLRMSQVPAAIERTQLRALAVQLVERLGWKIQADRESALLATTRHNMELTLIYENQGFLYNLRVKSNRFGRGPGRAPAQHREAREFRSALKKLGHSSESPT